MVTTMTSRLRLAFYGDDFTGSTDALESLACNGVETLLFFEPPTADDAELLDGLDAVGVAGQSRSMGPAEMDAELAPVFESLVELHPELIHYKVCSTFDSSPSVGSIGHAIDLGVAATGSPVVPLVVAAPSLAPRGRYVAFGNLFARMDGDTYRLDRHPTMSRHPVTPMTEADLRRHLASQTDRSIGLVDLIDLEAAAHDSFDRAADDHDIVVFDGITPAHQRTVGEVVWTRAKTVEPPLFSASSSGLGYALTAHWSAAGCVNRSGSHPPPARVDRLLVMSGSAAPETAAQIDWALEEGYVGHRLDTAALIDPDEAAAAIASATTAATAALGRDQSVVLYTARGPDDPAIHETIDRGEAIGTSASDLRTALGRAQGTITRRILETEPLDRICVAGGDTSGHVVRALDIRALSYHAPVAPGSPICVAHGEDAVRSDLQLALKGGQVMSDSPDPDYFERVRAGGR